MLFNNKEDFDEFMSSAKALDEYLSKISESPKWVIVNPYIWNGYWRVERHNSFLRWAGRKLKNKYVYWLGFQVHWESGLKEYVDIEREMYEKENYSLPCK